MNLKDLHSRKWRVVKPASLVGVFLLAVFLYTQVVFAASFVSVPSSTVSNGGWVNSGGASHHESTDEGATENITDYIQAPSGASVTPITFETTSPTSVDTATSVRLYINSRIVGTPGAPANTITGRVLINGSEVSTVTITPSTSGYTWQSATIANGTWSQSDIDSMRIELSRGERGSGNPNSRRDDVRVASVYVDVTYTSTQQLAQTGYRWLENADSATAGAPLAAQDTAISGDIGEQFRLRMLVGVSITSLTSSQEFKLQYKHQPSGTCTSTGTFSDVTSSSPIRFYDNASVSDAASLGTTANDPIRSGVTKINQTYEEANTFAATSTVADGQDGMWDFALKIGPTAEFSGMYCLRIAKADNSPLTTYSVMPEISVTVPAGLLTATDYRLYENADSLTPGTPLAATNTSATLGATNDDYRLRVGAKIDGYWKQVSSGGNHTCAIASDNQAYCWGQDTSGQLGNGGSGVSTQSPTAVDTSGVLSGKTILSISAGGSHTCAIASDNQAYCWGNDANGQLGNGGTAVNTQSPTAVDTSGVLSGKTILSISAYYHTCAIASDNQAYCWGRDSEGQLGNGGTAVNTQSPTAVDTSGVLSGKTILSISAGLTFTCAIASDNQAYCWGYDLSGQLGNGGSGVSTQSPTAVDTSGVLSGKTILSISAGDYHTCAIASDNQAYCWGGDGSGQLGNGGTPVDTQSPTAVDTSGVLSGKTILSISAGFSHTCAIASDNQAYCWGYDGSGQLGNGGSATDTQSPTAVDTSGVLRKLDMLSISSGTGRHSCAIASDNQAYCWGVGSDGQLGNSGTASSDIPVPVSTSGALSGKSILSIAVGAYHTCAIASDNNAYCWGSNIAGELGNGNIGTSQPSPVAVDTSGALSGKTVLSITAGNGNTCAIASDNQAYCWGGDTYGELGNGATTGNQSSPSAVDTGGALSGKTVYSISIGWYHACAIASDNNAYCWGYDGWGALGNGATNTNQPSPVAVDTSGVLSGKTIQSISAGYLHTCAVASDNQAYCWGDDTDGKLGNGAPTGIQNSPSAVDTSGVLSGKSIESISAAYYHTCAVTTDELAYCWGLETNGLLGNGSMTGSEPSPVSINTSGYLSTRTVLEISSGYLHSCLIASDNQVYCWGADDGAQLGNGAPTAAVSSPSPIVSDNLLKPLGMPTVDIQAQRLSLSLQFAQKTSGTCSAQTGFAAITSSTAIAFNDNTTPINGATITTGADDPVSTTISTAQSYHEAVGTITNPNTIGAGKVGLWDFSLRDNNAPADTTYCLRLAGAGGESFASYLYLPEITTAASGGGGGPTLDQRMRHGQSVINGTRSPFGWQ